MANLVEDGINFGFGLFAYSRDRIEKMVEKMVDAGKVERRDARSFAQQMIDAGEEQRKEVKKMVQDQVREDLDALGLTNQSSQNTSSGLTAEQVRQIVREELSAHDEGKPSGTAASKESK